MIVTEEKIEFAVRNCTAKEIDLLCDLLSDEERRFLTIHPESSIFKVLHRKLCFIEGKPVGFIEGYQFSTKKNELYLVTAVLNKYRSKGVLRYMLEDVVKHFSNDLEVCYLRWDAYKENEVSNLIASKYNFDYIGESELEYKYLKRI